jgi:hypothetical protein
VSEPVPEFVPELLNRLVDLVAAAVNNPGLWYAAAAAGFASVSLPFLRHMYGVRQREESRRHIADHVASGRITLNAAAVLLGQNTRAGLSAEGLHTTGWILGPLGVVTTVVGLWLGVAVHPGLFAIALGGAISMALSVSFLVIAAAKHKTGDTSPSPALLQPSEPLDS